MKFGSRVDLRTFLVEAAPNCMKVQIKDSNTP